MWRPAFLILLTCCIVGFDEASAGETSATRIPIELSSQAPAETTVVVEAGDHLWKISERHLEGSSRTIAPYWLQVIDLNTPTLRSGNPDLIYPGEVIELP